MMCSVLDTQIVCRKHRLHPCLTPHTHISTHAHIHTRSPHTLITHVPYSYDRVHFRFGSTLHWGPYYGEDKFASTHATAKAPAGGDFSTDFHTFGVEWSEDYLFTYLDTRDNVVLNVTFPTGGFWEKGGFDKMGAAGSTNNPWAGRGKAAPFDQEFYLVLNVAVGGTNAYFPDAVGGKPWANTSPSASLDFWHSKDAQWGKTWANNTAMKVDFVKVWQ